jgi:hypothetical protein
LEAKELLTLYRGDLSLFLMTASGVLFLRLPWEKLNIITEIKRAFFRTHKDT